MILLVSFVGIQMSLALIYFHCDFFHALWSLILRWAGLQTRRWSLKHELRWQHQFCPGRSIFSKWIRILLGVTVYELWAERNSKLWQRKSRTVNQIAFSVKFLSCARGFMFVSEEDLFS